MFVTFSQKFSETYFGSMLRNYAKSTPFVSELAPLSFEPKSGVSAKFFLCIFFPKYITKVM